MVGYSAAADSAFPLPPALTPWLSTWRARLSRQPAPPAEITALMRRHNPAFIPRNHKVEEALAAAEHGDLRSCHRLLEVIHQCTNHDHIAPDYDHPDPSGGIGYRTFCGT